MKWYAISLIFKSVVQDDEMDLYEQQIRLIQAEDDDHASHKAHLLGAATAHDYLNTYGQTVVWEFVGVESVQELLAEDLADGIEVYSRFFDPPKDFRPLPYKLEQTSVLEA